MEFLIEYGLFMAKTITIVVAVLVIVGFVLGMSQRQRTSEQGRIEARNLGETLKQVTQGLKDVVLDQDARKQDAKRKKRQAKAKRKSDKQAVKDEQRRPRTFVIDFKGDLQASAVTSLREEITAVLSIATGEDEVLCRLESPGGAVHGYGLAASQLQRVRSKGVPLTIAVDKVAASGGYMMACIAGKIIAAPFAILGSIGVVAQIPNFRRYLQGKDIDVEVLTAGEYKRTLTLFGENTEAGRQKMQGELEDVHTLFKDFVAEHRPQVDVDQVATGEYWYGKRALERNLVDELLTSDEYIVEQCQERDVFQVRYVLSKTRLERMMERFGGALASWRSLAERFVSMRGG